MSSGGAVVALKSPVKVLFVHVIHDKAICGGKAQYTSSPTNAPTLAPSSKAPTHAPTNVPTEATKEPTDTPTDTNAPTTQTPTTGAPTAASTTGTPTDPPTSNVSATKSPSTWQQGWREWFEMEESQIILGGSGALFAFLILALCAFCRARRHSKSTSLNCRTKMQRKVKLHRRLFKRTTTFAE